MGGGVGSLETRSLPSIQPSCRVGLCRGSIKHDFPPHPPPTKAPPQRHSLPWEGENCVVVRSGSAARGASGSDTMLKRKRFFR